MSKIYHTREFIPEDEAGKRMFRAACAVSVAIVAALLYVGFAYEYHNPYTHTGANYEHRDRSSTGN